MSWIARGRFKGRGLGAFTLFLAVCPAGPAQALSVQLSLEDLVRGSALIARAKVLEVRQAPGEHPRYRSVALVQPLNLLRGEVKGETVRVRFDNGFDCPNVHLKPGEEGLLFAEEETDGSYLPVATDNGWQRMGHPGGLEPAQILHLSGLVQHRARLRAVGGAGGDVALEMRIQNSGPEPLIIPNDLEVELRRPNGAEGVARRMPSWQPPTLILEPQALLAVKKRGKYREPTRLTLEPEDAASATVSIRDLLPGARRKLKVRAWLRVLGKLSDPVDLEVDLGEGGLPRKELEALQRKGFRRPADDGPFRITWQSRLRRWIGHNGGLLLFLALAAAGTAALSAIALRSRRGTRPLA